MQRFLVGCGIFLFLWGVTSLFAHDHATGMAPTVSSCGVTPSAVSGNDEVGTFTLGSGTITACTLSFASTWQSVPICVLTTDSAVSFASVSSISTTQVVIGLSASLPSGNIFYMCRGWS